jgi:hypothetical protein
VASDGRDHAAGVLLALYGMAGYAMTASMSVAANMDPAPASVAARLWLLLTGASLAVAVAGGVVLRRWRGGA